MRNRRGLRLALLAIFAVTLLPASTISARELRLASATSAQHHRHKGPLVFFAKRVEELTKGSLTVRILHSAVLGGEREYMELMRAGTLDMATLSMGPVAGFVKEFDVFNLPFLFKDTNHFWAVAGGPIGEAYLKKLEAIGVKGLVLHDDGTRNVFNRKRAVKTPDDLTGLRIRVQESPIFIANLNAMGASAVPMSYAEVYTALQQGVLDGAENTLNNMLTDRFWEVCKYLSLTAHMQVPQLNAISLRVFNTLSPAEQQTIVQAARESMDVNRQTVQTEQDNSLAQLKANGIQVTDVDRELFRAKTKSVYDAFISKMGKEEVDKILSLAK